MAIENDKETRGKPRIEPNPECFNVTTSGRWTVRLRRLRGYTARNVRKLARLPRLERGPAPP